MLDVLQMVLNQYAENFAVRRLRNELKQEAFLEITSADPQGIEFLDHFQGLFDLVDGNRGLEIAGDLVHRSLNTPVFINVSDQEASQLELLFGAIQKREL